MQDICLDHHIIWSISMYDHQFKSGYTEPYSSVEYDQIQAFECLESICEEENVVTSIGQIKEVKDEIVPGLVGPKRIEITLRNHGGGKEVKLVVVDVMPPSGHYSYYSVCGREWKVYQKKLDKTPTTIWGTGKWLARLDAYLGGGQGSATEHFTPQNQEQAWAQLEKMFYKFQKSELQVIRGWTVDEAGDAEYDDLVGYGGEFYGPTHRGQHWTNRTPSHYNTTPEKAHYRVSGDEVGAVLYREQHESWEEEGSPDPEQSLKELLEAKAEKKDEAGANSTSDGSGEASDTPDRCTDCGGTDCHTAYCNEDIDLGAYGGVVIDGSYTVH